MKALRITYWSSTILLSLMMAMSVFMYFTNPQVAENFKKAGFQDFFRIELGIAKAIGIVLLLLPMIPRNFKEWGYAGFFITFVSAFVAHAAAGDPASGFMGAAITLILLLVSYFSFTRLQAAPKSTAH